MSLPDYQFLPAPLWLLTSLHVLTLTLHFAAMNFIFGGVVVVLFGRFSDRSRDSTVGTMVRLFPTAMAATVSFGVAPLLFVQTVYHRQIYAAAIVSAWFWLLIVLVAILSYYCLYAAAFAAADAPWRRRAVPLWLALVGFVYISFAYSSVFSLAEDPELYIRLYAENQTGWVFNPAIKTYIFRWLHMVLGAIALGGFYVGLLGRDEPEAYATGKRFFLLGLVAASIAGFANLMTLGDVVAPMMASAAIWWLLIGVLLSLASLHLFFRRRFVGSGLALFVSLLAMVSTRHSVRLLRLADHLDLAAIPVRPQWSAFAMFALSLVLAVVLIAAMLTLYRRQQQA